MSTSFPMLALTSPRTKGGWVKAAQSHLKYNPYGDFLPGRPTEVVDGVFGTLTAHATRSAKYWLGYYEKGINERFGEELFSYLTAEGKPHHERLPLSNRRRRAGRLAAYRRHHLATRQARAVAVALSQVGYAPGLCSKYGAWYGLGCSEWCAEFISWNQWKVGSHFRYAYVPYICGDAERSHNGLGLTREPYRGCLTTFDWNHDGTADHVEYFIEWVSRSAGSFWTVGGNTGSGGGHVLRQERYTSEMWRSGEFVTVTS